MAVIGHTVIMTIAFCIIAKYNKLNIEHFLLKVYDVHIHV